MNKKMIIFLLITILFLIIVRSIYSPIIYSAFIAGFILGGINFAIYKELEDNEY